MKKIYPLILVALLMLSGCSKKDTQPLQSSSENTSSAKAAEVEFAKDDAEMFTDRDKLTDYDTENSVTIKLDGGTADCSSDAVQISGSTVTITDEGTYIISGSLSDGSIVVNADEKDKPHLVFSDVDINSKTSAPLYVLSAEKVVVTLAEGSKNKLSNGGSFEAIDDNNIDGTVFSKQDITFNGNGSLEVSSPAGHGIVAKDDLVFTGGTYTVNCASHGIDANDSVRVTDSMITIASGKDGIHSENNDDSSKGFVYISGGTIDITAEGDGISSLAYTQIEGGNFNIKSGGGSVNAAKQTSDNWGGFMGGRGQHGPTAENTETEENSTSIKGIKSSGEMLISGGSFNIDSADDAVHSNVSITVNGGNFKISSGDDGFHADETLTITSANIEISESYEGLEALDIKVSGGNISLVASDDGLNAAGGTDSSGFGGMRGGDQFGGGGNRGGPGGMSSSSNGSIVISGGNLTITASGDGIDANGTLEITGGKTIVSGPTQGDTATLDYDVSATISGGTFIGTGASGMAQTFSDSKQGLISVSAGNQSVGTQIILTDSKGKELVSYTPQLSFNVVILSTPEMVSGESYTLTVGSLSEKITAN